MVNKLKLVSKLEGTFPVKIKVTDLDGTEFEVEFDCFARTQKAWAKERDVMLADARAKVKERVDKAKADAGKKKTESAEAEDLENISVEKIATESLNSEATLSLKIASGWKLDEAFTVENIEILEDRFPGSIFALHEEYSKAIHGNGRKN